jgi:hypothetical protein
MKIENVKISELKPLEKNVRRHNDKQIEEMIRSVQQFGQTRAIVIDEENNILIGNGLYMALVKMGIEECQCYRKTGLTEIQKKKLILTDNKVYSLGADDYDGIQNYIQEITVTGDFDIAGFDDYILKNMVITEEENEEVMQEYGKITDVKFVQDEPIQTVSTPTETTNSSPEVVQTVEKVATVVTEKQVSAPKTEKKYVICPSCGEVIYID